MRRVLATAIVLTLVAALGGDGARADTPSGDPPLVERRGDGPDCCAVPGGYRGRTQFVVEMLRSVEAL